MIRPAGPAHAAWMAALHVAATPEGERWTAASFAALLGQPGVAGLLDEHGFILLRLAVGEAEILTLTVHPDARRQGHGRALLAEAMRQAARHGATEMFLEVAETNAAARALYHGAGFVRVGRRPRYYADGTAALVLRAGLTGAS